MTGSMSQILARVAQLNEQSAALREFTEDELEAIAIRRDLAYAADKASGALQARQERRALDRQMDAVAQGRMS
jgi:hypothetical protein